MHNPLSPRFRRASFAPAIESLEFRRLLSAAPQPQAPVPGQSASASDTIAMYTYGGDSNLDGTINIDDYGIIDGNIGAQGSPNPTAPTHVSVYGTAGDDRIVIFTATTGSRMARINGVTSIVGPGPLLIDARAGNDVISIEDGSFDPVTVYGGSGNDTIFTGASSDHIFAGSGDDLVNSGNGRDTVYGEYGNDSLRGGGGTDLLDGADGYDTLRGDAGNDHLWGGANPDRLRGGEGDDDLHGGGGRDILAGQDGDDTLNGDSGDDYLDGGAGINFPRGGSGHDSIYASADDEVDLKETDLAEVFGPWLSRYDDGGFSGLGSSPV